MEIYEKARLAQLAAKLRLNALNGNAANGAAPGYAVRPTRTGATAAAGRPASGASPVGAQANPSCAPSLFREAQDRCR